MKVHHIGYLVRKIDKAISSFLDLGYVILQDTVLDEYRKIKVCFLKKDEYIIELVSPVSKDSVVSGLIKKGNSPYHICYETDSFDDDVQRLLKKNFIMCSEKHEAVAINGKNVCFLVHPYMGMIELLEA